ncbi:M56 family metallopeptidase [Pseudonocardia sp. D17]|uniref:M56 family metallopeptidase n=1 Tax=Pseudonocardia sp. D17 TaxID=882661 RepID=UPI0030CCDECE
MLVVGAALTGVFGPRLLIGLERSSASPAALLCVWWSALTWMAVSAIAALAVLLIPIHDGAPAPLAQLLATCYASLTSSQFHPDEVGAALITVLVLMGLFRAIGRGGRSVRAVRQEAETTMWMLEPAGTWEHGVLWLDHPSAVAFSVGGRAKAIVATSGLRRILSPLETTAVLAHERAHLSGRHHVQVLLADALAAAVPLLPLFREAPAVIRRLVELAADDQAARYVSADVVRRALVSVAIGGDQGLPPAALGAATSSIEVRLARLARPVRLRSRPGQAGEKACFVAAGALIPLLTGAASVAAFITVSCV